MANFDELHQNLKGQLQTLRDSVPALKDDPQYLEVFDEFLREYEFGLALETLCDFLLEPRVPLVSEALLEQIENLHQQMHVEDGVRNLRNKAVRSKTV
jgi:hypothetical protein